VQWRAATNGNSAGAPVSWRAYLYAEEAFPLCDLYEKAVTPLSIFYALIGKYPASAGPCADGVELDQDARAGPVDGVYRVPIEEPLRSVQ
jgi:hypothetical protein